MYPYFYEKEADAANYIYFQKNLITEDQIYNMLPHYHDSVEFVLMQRGACRIHIGTEERTVRAGEVTFVRCFEPHYYVPDAGAEYYVVLISSGYLKEFDAFRKQTFASFLGKNERFEQVIAFLDYLYPLWETANEAMKKGFAEMLLGLMTLWYPMEEGKSQKSTQAFVEILKFINENFSGEITLEGLAERFGYTKTYLSEQFNRFAGMPLREYINRRRINEFYRRKRDDPAAPSCRIAAEVGFKSLNTFYRALHKYPNF